MKKILRFIVGAIVLSGVMYYTIDIVVVYPNKSKISAEPQQEAIERYSFPRGKYTITPVANFDVTGRVLSKKRYYTGDFAQIVPYDFAIGWGKMSSEIFIRGIKVWQKG